MILHRSLALAVFAAVLGATASANPASHNQPVPGKHRVSLVPAATGTFYTAVVSSTGNLVRGIGAVTAAPHSGNTGEYVVSFVTDVTSCAYVVTVGQTGSNGQQDARAASVVGRSGDSSAVFIQTFKKTGVLANAPFHVDVAC